MTFFSRPQFVMGNWKMYGTNQTIHALLQQIKSIQPENHQNIIVFPPYVYLEKAAWELRHSAIKLGAQNLCAYEGPACTGEISGTMLKDSKAQYVLIGHSERRQYFAETPEIILEKFIHASKAGLKSVLCVGETLAEYQSHQTQQKVLAQIESVIKSPRALAYLDLLTIAYEPVWAIGTGLTAEPTQAQKVHLFIREIIAEVNENLASKMPILYGGSVKSTNAKELFAMPDIDGGLVGGASLIGEEFQAICHAMKKG